MQVIIFLESIKNVQLLVFSEDFFFLFKKWYEVQIKEGS